MSEMDDKLNAILSNPQMMQQIMSLAQSLGNNQQADSKQAKTTPPMPSSSISPSVISKVSNLMQYGTIDTNQQSLLKALSPYLSSAKLQKLERAMHAAKMASFATEMIGLSGANHSNGR